MPLSDLHTESLDTATLEYWQRERMAPPVWVFAVHLHVAGLSLRKTEAVLHLLGVDRSFQAIF